MEIKPQVKEFSVNLPNSGEAHELSYTDWGSGERLLLCVHGLTRNGRDFDYIARALAPDCRVICPDMPGRGKSQWLKNPALYNNNYYVEICRALIADLGYAQVDWLGTSMGGLMGMIAAAVYPKLIRKMVLNDVGPYIGAEGVQRIGSYLKDEVKFPTREAAMEKMREIYTPFKLEENQWPHMFEHGLRSNEREEWSFNHDPKLGAVFKNGKGGMALGEVDLWRLWEAIKIPVLVLRGENSDILLREVAQRMQKRPNTEVVEFAGYAHVPPLINDEQIGAVKRFLIDD